jgi:hypothetical protein
MANGLSIYDDARISAIAAFEGNFLELEKLALETMARTARDPLECFELALKMMRLRKTLTDIRQKR